MQNIPKIGNRVLGLLLGMVITFFSLSGHQTHRLGQARPVGRIRYWYAHPEQRPEFFGDIKYLSLGC